MADELSLSSRLKKSRTQIFPDEKEWIQFVKDHRPYLLENSDLITIGYDDQNTYRYRLYSYLVDIGKNTEILWVTLWLNQMDTEMDFDGISELYLPRLEYLNTLRQTYRSFRSKFRKESQ